MTPNTANASFLYNRAGEVLDSGVVKYVEVPVNELGAVACQIAWLDATSDATITLELTNYGRAEAPVDDPGDDNVWKDSGVSITGPAGAAVGSVFVVALDKWCKRARLKIDPAADSRIQVLAP